MKKIKAAKWSKPHQKKEKKVVLFLPAIFLMHTLFSLLHTEELFHSLVDNFAFLKFHYRSPVTGLKLEKS